MVYYVWQLLHWLLIFFYIRFLILCRKNIKFKFSIRISLIINLWAQFNSLIKKSNQMLIWKELILFGDQPPSQEGSPESHSYVVIHVVCEACQLVPSDFSNLCVWSLLSFLCPLQSLFHVLSSGVNHNVTTRGWLLPSPSLTGSNTWCPVPQ